jgi:hypothetical protein
MSDTIDLRIELDSDLFHLKAMLHAMLCTLGNQYWKDDPDGHERHDTLMSLVEYAQGLREEIEETARKIVHLNAIACRSQQQASEEQQATAE